MRQQQHASQLDLALRMARVRLPDYEIAFVLGLSVKMLLTTYGEAMRTAAIMANLQVQETLLSFAISGKNLPATMHWSKMHNIYLKNQVQQKEEDSRITLPGSIIVLPYPDEEAPPSSA